MHGVDIFPLTCADDLGYGQQLKVQVGICVGHQTVVTAVMTVHPVYVITHKRAGQVCTF